MPHYISVVFPCKNNPSASVKFRFPFEGHEFLMASHNDNRYQWDDERQEIYDTTTQSKAPWSTPSAIATAAMFALNL